MRDDRKKIDWERPDWTPDEVGDEPPFTFAGSFTKVRRTEKAERRTGRLIWACLAVIVGCAAVMVAL